MTVCVPAQKIHASSETYLALIKDNAYELQLRGEIEVKVKVWSQLESSLCFLDVFFVQFQKVNKCNMVKFTSSHFI